MSELPSTSTASSVQTRRVTDNVEKLDLIGRISHQITGAKLPSNRQLLQVLFYNIRFVDRQLRGSAKLTISAALIYWQQARIPTRDLFRCVEKLEKLYKTYRNILKTVPSKRSVAQKNTVTAFSDELDDLFDVAAANALEQIRSDEDKQFLILQRQKGRPGCMAGVDMSLYRREKRREERLEKEESRKRKCVEMSAVQCTYRERIPLFRIFM